MGSSLPLPTHLGFLQIAKPILALESENAVGYVLVCPLLTPSISLRMLNDKERKECEETVGSHLG